MSSSKKITLRSSDGESFEVDEAVALESLTIKHMVDVNCADNEIPLLNVTSEILAKVIEYCKKHVETPKGEDRSNNAADDDLKTWDAAFVMVDQETLFEILKAASYLNIKGLAELISQTVAASIRWKTTEDLRKEFDIENDFTPEEEKQFAGRIRGHTLLDSKIFRCFKF